MKSDKYKILCESTNPNVDKLVELYKKDRHKARVVFMNSNSIDYSIKRVVIFFHEKGKFNIVHFKRSFGISKSNKMYSSQSQIEQIIYKDNKLWHRFITRGGLQLRALCLMGLQSWDGNTEKEVRAFLIEKFSWLRFVTECNIQELTFNTIIKNKLYSLNDCLKYMYKVPLPIAKLFFEKKMVIVNNQHYTWHKALKIYKPYLTNIENLKTDFLDSSLFADTLRMAKILGKTINCSWGLKRLTQEHDDWAKEITNIVLENEPLKELNVGGLFIKFAEYSGYKLLTTNKELLAEGMRQQHCVGTYIDAVDSGRSGIYHVEGYTLELVKDNLKTNDIGGGWIASTYSVDETKINRLKISQFRGLRNSNVPDLLYNKVNDKLIEFNKILNKKESNDELVGDVLEKKPLIRSLIDDIDDLDIDNGFI